MPEKFDIYSKILYMDVEKFVRHLCRLVLRHQMPVWNYFVNSFYSVLNFPKFCNSVILLIMVLQVCYESTVNRAYFYQDLISLLCIMEIERAIWLYRWSE